MPRIGCSDLAVVLIDQAEVLFDAGSGAFGRSISAVIEACPSLDADEISMTLQTLDEQEGGGRNGPGSNQRNLAFKAIKRIDLPTKIFRKLERATWSDRVQILTDASSPLPPALWAALEPHVASIREVLVAEKKALSHNR